MSAPILSVRNVSSSYTNRSMGLFGKKTVKPVLDNVNLEIMKGEVFGLSGESGSGKTTLGRCILGLLEYEGEIIIDGLGKKTGFRERALKLGAVFQAPGAALNPVKKIGWLLEEPLIANRAVRKTLTKKERQFKADEMLEMIGLDASYKKRLPAELSSGQKQRISIGCSLMLRPSLLIADEPVSSLDVSTGAQIVSLFKDLNQALGLSLLFISHNINIVNYLCGRTAVMERGRIV